jgi:uncharacterized protein (DUF1330 family)
MAKGSFSGLYTFEEISKIYQMESSNLRKMVQYNKFTDKEIKKFGKTWIITEDAVRKHFGDNIDTYFNDIKLNELKDMKNIHREVESAAVTDLSVKDDLGKVENFEYVEVDPASVVSSFTFSK